MNKRSQSLKFSPFFVIAGIGSGLSIALYGLTREALIFGLVYFVAGVLGRLCFDLCAFALRSTILKRRRYTAAKCK